MKLLIALVLAAAALWGFIEIADEVLEGESHAFDSAVLLALRDAADPSDPVGPQWLEEMARDLTALGGVAVLVLLTAAAVGYLLLERKRHAALAVLAATAGGLALSSVLKLGFDRERPDLVPHLAEVYTASFPSGHSMMAAVTYLTLAALLAQVQPSWRLRAYLIGIAIAVTVLVGVSRIYLGVHWPSDVAAGWTLGACWAIACWLGMRALQRRGAVERA